jgi:prepilin-type N-terminal cleavage/methylation domain-containing protein
MPPAPPLLIIDDDPERRNFLATEMAVEGYSREETATDQLALSKIRGHERDLVLLDWTQPARGFTLVELMIVVAIVGLLSAVVLSV